MNEKDIVDQAFYDAFPWGILPEEEEETDNSLAKEDDLDNNLTSD